MPRGLNKFPVLRIMSDFGEAALKGMIEHFVSELPHALFEADEIDGV
jgi:hypothetical protein